MSKRESHKQALRTIIDRFVGDRLGPAFKEQLIEEVLRVNERFNHNPSLDDALNSGNGSYKP